MRKILSALLIITLLFGSGFILSITTPSHVHAQENITLQRHTVDDTISILLPEDWAVTRTKDEDDRLYFGENEEAANNRFVFWKEDTSQPVNGSGGVIAIFTSDGLREYNPDRPITDNLDAFIDAVELTGYRSAVVLHSVPFDMAYAEVEWGAQRGFLSIAPVDAGRVALIFLGHDPAQFNDTQDLLFNILQLIRVPPSPEDTFISDELEYTTLLLPADWLHEDRLRENGSIIIGENEEAIENRIVFWDSDNQIEAVDRGGIIAFYELDSLFFVSLENNEVTNFEVIVDNVDGLDFIEPPAPLLTENYTAAYAVIDWNNQRGLMALFRMEDINYWVIFIMTSTPETFEDNRALYFSILHTLQFSAVTGIDEMQFNTINDNE